MPLRSIAAFALVLGVLACESPPRASEDLPRAGPGVLYAIGANLGIQITEYDLDDAETREVARGLTDTVRHNPYAAPFSPETAALLTEFDTKRRQELARREEQAGAPTLEAAAREPGAVKTESGMILRVIEKGSGPSPTIWDYVTVNYHGTLRDGTVFYSNRGQKPLHERLGTQIRCWQEAFAAVGVGGRMHVVCPPALGYTWGGWPNVVRGGAVLTYDLELLAVEPMPEPPPAHY
jgi:FKBP-type peptidyl-prolyl cis-trans isomerase FkpA